MRYLNEVSQETHIHGLGCMSGAVGHLLLLLHGHWLLLLLLLSRLHCTELLRVDSAAGSALILLPHSQQVESGIRTDVLFTGGWVNGAAN